MDVASEPTTCPMLLLQCKSIRVFTHRLTDFFELSGALNTRMKLHSKLMHPELESRPSGVGGDDGATGFTWSVREGGWISSIFLGMGIGWIGIEMLSERELRRRTTRRGSRASSIELNLGEYGSTRSYNCARCRDSQLSAIRGVFELRDDGRRRSSTTPSTNANADTDDKAWLATPDTMGTLVAQPNNDVDAAFKDHLLAVLSLHDAPRAAAAPIPRYSGPTDWQTEAILRKVEALLRDSGAAAIMTPTPMKRRVTEYAANWLLFALFSNSLSRRY
ncbi:hypothetical protein B0H16DRAFT_1484940 [Mycena metata]|uniref:Uncharacterized protein n=1 Tax=Mycena metata TaxID=1033252 RepID=A0AAD7DPI3_9AGAR|nr:hypothetical protein B0H16DRAFT_1484940 [Mycena metata]